MTTKELVCIVCPNGCRLHIAGDGEQAVVTGGRCQKGETFARAELWHPMRTLTTTVRTVFSEMPVLPVRTAGELPKEALFPAMEAIRHLLVEQPVTCGEVLVENLAGTGVTLIATSGVGPVNAHI